MDVTKVLDAIRETCEGRTLPKMQRVAGIYEADAPMVMDADQQWRWKYGVTVFVNMHGPESARQEIAAQARTMLAREVYGEVFYLVLDVLEEARSETYRSKDDPLVKKIEAVLDACSGGRQ